MGKFNIFMQIGWKKLKIEEMISLREINGKKLFSK
jgi:hypothetical protein